MKMLVCINVNHEKKAGLYRSIFNRLEWLKSDNEIIENYDIVSLHQEYVGVLKKLNSRKGFTNSFTKNCSKFVERNLECKYININTNLINRFLEKKSAKYQVNRKYNELKKNVNIRNYDLINVHGAYPEGVVVNMAKKEFGIKYVLTVHGSDINVVPNESEEKKEMILEALEDAEKVIFVSEGLLNTAKSFGYSGRNSIVIPNGFSKEEFFKIDKETAKRDLGITKKSIGFVGNLQYVKRADKLPMIFKEIHKLDKDTEFLVIGDGPYKKNLIEKCKEYNLPLKFFGRVELKEVNKYMNAMDVLILPSRNEGWPCVVLEAMACGVTVIGTNKGGIAEAISTYGYTVDENDNFENDFAAKTIVALKKNINRNQCEYIEKYTWENINILEKKLFASIEV